MISYLWPVGLIVLSNVVYHICTKSSPEGANPFATLAVTYSVGAILSLALFFLLDRGDGLVREVTKLNWVPYVLGTVIVGLEVGNLYAYRAGWQVNTQSIVQSVFLAVALLFVGYFLYQEKITANKVVGIVICIAGLYVVNK